MISYFSGSGKNIAKSIAGYLVFCLGRIVVYVGLGICVFVFGEMASEHISASASRYLSVLGGAFIVLIGFLMTIGRNLDNKICLRLNKVFLQNDFKTVMLFGAIIGILPCLPLSSVLAYIGLTAKNFMSAIIFSLSFGLGTLVSPLFLLVALSGFSPLLFRKETRFHQLFNSICGLIVLFLGVRLLAVTLR